MKNAMFVELIATGLQCEKQKQIRVYYNGQAVGEYYSDMVVNDCVIVELKSSERLVKEHTLQLINYLKATNLEIGLLLNFGKKPEFKRKIFTNDKKNMKPV